ncbi:MAG: sulfatase-like hydrolase/transferase [Myxococcota bacterium]|nr:sulfatase-like hydrolase/transferase [Myxococcota bacterium]
MILVLTACTTAPPPDIVLVTWDTVRADRVDGLATWEGLAAEGITFSEARSPVPITLPAHATMMTGRYPPSHGARDNGRFTIDTDAPMLAEALSEAGYQTAGFVSAPVLGRTTGIARGFSVFDDAVSAPYRPADQTVDAALAWLDRRDPARPVFLWVHLFDAHRPWLPTRAAWEAAGGDAYAAEIASVDAATGRIAAALSDNALLALTADHGEGLGEHGEETHAWFAYDSTLAIPLLLWWGAGLDLGERGGTITAPATLADLSPTLRRLAGLPPIATDGADLLDLPAQRTVPVETVAPVYIMGAAPVFGTINTGTDAWLDLPSPEHYDLSTDPGQTDNRYRPEEAAALAEAVGAYPRRWPQEAAELSAATTAQLAALGYISGASSGDTEAPDPKDRLDLFNLLSTPRTQHPPEEALRLGEAMRVKYGLSTELALYIADCLGALGRLSDGLSVLEEALVAAPDDPRLLAAAALRRERRGAMEQQVVAIRAALAADPDHPTAHYDLGVTLTYLEALEEAESRLREAMARSPGDAQARRALAMVLRSQGHPAEAAEILQPVAEIMPVPCDLGRLFSVYLDQPQAARPLLEQCWDGGGRMTAPDYETLRGGD